MALGPGDRPRMADLRPGWSLPEKSFVSRLDTSPWGILGFCDDPQRRRHTLFFFRSELKGLVQRHMLPGEVEWGLSPAGETRTIAGAGVRATTNEGPQNSCAVFWCRNAPGEISGHVLMLGFVLGHQTLLLKPEWESHVSQTVGLVRQTLLRALVPLGCIPAACSTLLTSSRDGVAARQRPGGRLGVERSP